MNLTFKEKLKNDFIPQIKEMIEKEKTHLEWLKTLDQKDEDILKFISKSSSFLNHLEFRYYQYLDYINQL